MGTLKASVKPGMTSDEASASLDSATRAQTYAPSIRPAVCPSSLRRADSRPPLRTTFKDFSTVVPVVVGDGEAADRPRTRYLVHKELCTAASPFFAAALDDGRGGGFRETAEQAVHLPAERPEVFEWFLQWLYTGTLTSPLSAEAGGGGGTRDTHVDGDLCDRAGSPKFFLLLDLWALADRLLADALCDLLLSTIARLAETTNSVPTPADTWLLYDELPEHAGLRDLIVDLFAHKKTGRLLEAHEDAWHPRFLFDLVVKLKRPADEAKACEGCQALQAPHEALQKCCECARVFGAGCLERHEGALRWASLHDGHGCGRWQGTNTYRSCHEHEHARKGDRK
nr:hypothetical protein CFP56_38777 [Quercus suber]